MKGIKHASIVTLKEYSELFENLTIPEAFSLAKKLHPDVLGNMTLENFTENIKDKGSAGKLIEHLLYGIPNNSAQEADLKGLIESGEDPPDIKCTKFKCLKNGKGENATERITCTNIGPVNSNDDKKKKEYRDKIIDSTTFKESVFMGKCTKMLLILMERGENSSKDIMSKKIKCVLLLDLYEEYADILEEDWKHIREAAMDSSKDIGEGNITTQCLSCPQHGGKSSSEVSRALAIKQPFVTRIVGEYLQKKYDRKDIFIKTGRSPYIDFSKAKPRTDE